MNNIISFLTKGYAISAQQIFLSFHNIQRNYVNTSVKVNPNWLTSKRKLPFWYVYILVVKIPTRIMNVYKKCVLLILTLALVTLSIYKISETNYNNTLSEDNIITSFTSKSSAKQGSNENQNRGNSIER